MAVYFVASGGSDTAPYDTWAKASTSLQTALTAASTAGDIVVIQYDGVPAGDAEAAANVTYTFNATCSVISASNDGGSAYTPTAMGDANWIGNSTAGRSIVIAGVQQVYVYGITLRIAAVNATVDLRPTPDGSAMTYDSCTFWQGSTSPSPFIYLGPTAGTGNNSKGIFKTCVFRFGHATQGFVSSNHIEMFSCYLHASTVAPSSIFKLGVGYSSVLCDACDWSLSGTTMVGSAGSSAKTSHIFVNCDVPSTLTWLATQTPLSLASSEVYVFNCASGDTHYDFGYYNALGSVVSTTGIYAAGGAKFDGTNGVSWQIDTTSSASYYAPFVTPWIDLYHSGTSAITPSIEVVRSGSATAYDNDEVWGEFSYQGTSGSTKATIVDDKMAIGGTPAAQTTGDLGAGDWTGENATSWFGKLNTTSTITPAEIGMLRARVCVGVASSTVYVDPYIRVA